MVLKAVKSMFKLLNFKQETGNNSSSLAFQYEKYQGLIIFENNIVIMASYKNLIQAQKQD